MYAAANDEYDNFLDTVGYNLDLDVDELGRASRRELVGIRDDIDDLARDWPDVAAAS